MCIRDRLTPLERLGDFVEHAHGMTPAWRGAMDGRRLSSPCLLYTSDAADERSSVDLGGRRILKKKKKKRGVTGRLMRLDNTANRIISLYLIIISYQIF